jgi:hypothetical protein
MKVIKMKHKLSVIILSLLSISIGKTDNLNLGELWINRILAYQNVDKNEYIQNILKYNCSSLWTYAKSMYIYGFIGDNYQRIQIHFSSVRKDEQNRNQYKVVGKSKVKNNICDFNGIIKITNARKLIESVEKDITQGIIISKCIFRENPNEKYSGIFEGIMTTYFYINKNNKIIYDNLEGGADGYNNNQFVGTWKSYKNTIIKKCNWGDFRIPYGEIIDSGAGDFHPIDEIINNGWENFKLERDSCIKAEEIEWWK